jgi:hypothetical protein
MGHSSHAAARSENAFDTDEVPTVRLNALRVSRMPASNAVIAMPLVEETFRSLGTEPPGRPDNDALTEDELFVIWRARLL